MDSVHEFNPKFDSSVNLVSMFFAIGFTLSIVVAFLSPYVWEGITESPALPTATTTIVGLFIFAGGGYLLDRRNRRLRRRSEVDGAPVEIPGDHAA